MNKYLTEIEFAAKSLIALIFADFHELEALKKSLKEMTPEMEIKHQIFMANEFHPAANFYHAQMAKAFGQRNQAIQHKISSLIFNIDSKSGSITALSTALLQIAKHGISITYGKPENSPQGDNLNGILIKEIIWESRNQANHYENPKEISVKVEKLFDRLDKLRNDGEIWDPKSKVNFSFEVIKLLGWLDYEQFRNHMSSICRK